MSTADLRVRVHLCMQTTASRLPSLSVSAGLHPRLNAGSQKSISLRRATRGGRGGQDSKQHAEKQAYNLADAQAAFYLILLFPPLTSSVMLRLQCPEVPNSSSHRDMFGLHEADDY